jgi:acyl-CoA synthetase (AMP-forming)/AMP-acid ligase II
MPLRPHSSRSGDPAGAPGSSWTETLEARAAATPGKHAFRWLHRRGDEGDPLTYGALHRRAASIADALRRDGLAGQRALILHQPGPGFIEAFLGCLAGGVVAVPVYPPSPVRPDAALDRLLGIIADCSPAVVLTGTDQVEGLRTLAAQHAALASLSVLETETIPDDTAAPWRPPAASADTLAFLQYTSGSTSEPKGVMVTHRNVTENAARIGQALSIDDDSRGLSWLPPYHDMGLIGHVLSPIGYGIESLLMPPLTFLQRPMRWLEAISNFRATISFAPDFAYDLAARKAKPEHLARLDLSYWRSAGNGAEPVRAETIERFVATFAPCGFSAEAFCPSYGLAEATLLVTSRHGVVPVEVDVTALGEGRAVECTDDRQNRQPLVSVGPPANGLDLEIVDPQHGTRLPDGCVGEIWVAGSSVAAGYWQRPVETEATFGARLTNPDAGPFLRTGDFGFRLRGELYVTGRLKELIVIDGRNHYPQDIERTAETRPVVRPGGVMVFSVEGHGGERAVAVIEVARKTPAEMRTETSLRQVAAEIRSAVSERHGLALRDIIWVHSGSLPRTGSGKPRRRSCRDLYLRDALPEVIVRS